MKHHFTVLFYTLIYFFFHPAPDFFAICFDYILLRPVFESLELIRCSMAKHFLLSVSENETLKDENGSIGSRQLCIRPCGKIFWPFFEGNFALKFDKPKSSAVKPSPPPLRAMVTEVTVWNLGCTYAELSSPRIWITVIRRAQPLQKSPLWQKKEEPHLCCAADLPSLTPT